MSKSAIVVEKGKGHDYHVIRDIGNGGKQIKVNERLCKSKRMTSLFVTRNLLAKKFHQIICFSPCCISQIIIRLFNNKLHWSFHPYCLLTRLFFPLLVVKTIRCATLPNNIVFQATHDFQTQSLL